MGLNITSGAIAARLPADIRELIVAHTDAALLIENGEVVGVRVSGEERRTDPSLERVVRAWPDLSGAARWGIVHNAEGARAWEKAVRM